MGAGEEEVRGTFFRTLRTNCRQKDFFSNVTTSLIPSHPSIHHTTHRFECWKAFFSDLKQIVLISEKCISLFLFGFSSVLTKLPRPQSSSWLKLTTTMRKGLIFSLILNIQLNQYIICIYTIYWNWQRRWGKVFFDIKHSNQYIMIYNNKERFEFFFDIKHSN